MQNLTYDDIQNLFNKAIERIPAPEIISSDDDLNIFIKIQPKEDEVIPKIKKVYNSKKYNVAFSLKNSAKIKEKVVCSTCCGSYTYFNKSKHIRSKKHIDISEKIKQLVQM